MTNRGAYSHREIRCPACHSAHMIKLVRNSQMRCRDCGHGCTQEEAARAAKRVNATIVRTSGSGVITPLSYRQQMARDLLAEHEKARRS
jgi:transcription initiation factor TFIIIB Brf1 subunit/transcription initiation factor TFIIB